MPPMLAELKRDPSLGLLHAEFFLYWRGVGLIQYWRSFEQLHAYAHARNAAHLPAWAEFNRRIGGNGVVGIWHETYTVTPGQYETIYVNMPRFGLGGAMPLVPVTGRLDNARGASGKRRRRAGSESVKDEERRGNQARGGYAVVPAQMRAEVKSGEDAEYHQGNDLLDHFELDGVKRSAPMRFAGT